MPRHSLAEFLALPYPILDVRAPLEYAQGHIPGALSLPLFTDEERARIGTTYKQVSQEKAVLLGLDFFGPRMSTMVKQAQRLAPGRQVRLHCWRGGMRSGAVLWLLELAGFTVHLLDKGYKDYRRAVLAEFERPRSWRVLGGFTGSGKTDVLQHLAQAPHQQPVLDLEKLACHKGSSFGSIGQPAQPTQEQFENELAAVLTTLPAAPIWVEDESRQIGRLTIPLPLFEQLQQAPRWVLDVPRPARVAKLAAEYGSQDPALLSEAVQRLAKRLGGLATKEALAAIAAGDMARMVELCLNYYDKTYAFGLIGQPGSPPQTTVSVSSSDTAANALTLLNAA
ncbi:tRNA 2-selenouridine(34) synthase MnmH [Hymenobacter saemangeumensis]|uniref:tRNA 2-selenouridine(34) synthase MnmH n=1 Tax=Hymenobacter saemangeumensis TaxID=1084522 RepID=A0ABP8IQF7_9BACT